MCLRASFGVILSDHKDRPPGCHRLMLFSLLRSLLSKLYLTTLQQQLSWRETIQERKCEGWKFWDGRLADQLRLGRIGIMIEDYGLTHERRKEIVFCLFVMLVLSEGVSTNA
jgi:hypothetical protein